MKILELRFKNLNSLYGEWQIDFKHSDYENNSIFVLTGPTGAGKTTILDAICLALYGATPRLGKITQKSNEIISKKSYECYAEVVFKTNNTDIYRVQWAQHRSHRRIDGQLQAPRHEIAKLPNNQIINQKNSSVLEIIEEKTGMDFNRFTRAILLAQGQFDQFLKADIEKKSEILEQITGTDIYSAISIQVFERQKKEKDLLQKINDELSSIKILDDNKEIELKQKVNQHNQAVQSLQTELDTLQKAKQCFETIASLQKKIEKGKDQLTEKNICLEEVNKNFKELSKSVKESNEQLKKAQLDYETQLKLWEQVRQLDTKLQKGEDDLKNIENNLIDAQEKLEEFNKKLKDQKTELENSSAKQDELNIFLQEHSNDEVLSKELSGLRHILEQIQLKKENYQETIKKQENNQNKITQQEQKVEQFPANKDKSQKEKELLEIKEELKKLLKNETLDFYRKQKDNLYQNIILQKKIQNLETERKQLTNGNPCPLCGSTHHPYQTDNVPVLQDDQKKLKDLETLIREAETLEQTILDKKEELQQIVTENELEKERLNSDLNILRRDQENIRSNVEQIEEEIKNLNSRLESLKSKISLNPEQGNSIQKWQKIVETWENKNKEHNTLTETILQLNQEISITKTKIDNQENEKQRLIKEKNELSPIHKKHQEQRQELLGENDPNILEEKTKNDLESLKGNNESLDRKLQSTEQELNTIKGNIAILEPEISNDEEELQKNKDSIPDNLATKSTADIQSQIEQINQKKNEINQSIGSISSTIKANEEAKKNNLAKIDLKKKQKKECDKWDLLYDLVGSSDGKKYRAFAQSLTFEFMIHNANLQLQQMSDRYLLTQNQNKLLTLDVIDNYQAGEIRSSINLSGGESFIVSLALALGLANMASQKFSVDSLFLDEGFGTLDTEALDIALETLASLKQTGKLIGIVSHVSSLKDRIGIQIQVTPSSGGKSSLKGPGVKQILN